ncbi:Uncharacterized conserved protein, DUF1015 family [Geodermatophilus dictyosporus]|uniref:Uncharacterized conserved protein, DUF1015 family n=1 Tax=Geodermatophilus dictyosporus TaxID=1523247 RepID=A0A1I5K3P3_9ACTN|nr:DUF1015 domain-containing protein [Geodermatophilus dictyosporus]SFO79608.1 Uncharacterized conserved protein, DUF1015 family [Geodermatophilus dictyosporus]
MHASSAGAPRPVPTGLDVRPFRALTYSHRDPGHLARVSSPAYDLVTPDGRARLAAADPHNIVRLILPGGTPAAGSAGAPTTRGPARREEGGPAERAAHLLRAWEAEGVLVRDGTAALWCYELAPAQAPATVGWLGAVSVDGARRAVLPHEDTFPAAVEGRRALLAATATDLEPIVLAHDPEPEVTELTRAALTGRPAMEVTDADGVRHRLWRVTDDETLRRLSAALARTGAVIADGHHRFAAAQALHRTHPAGDCRVLALLTPMGAGGLRVEAIHRVVPDLALDAAAAAALRGFTVTEVPVAAGPGAVAAAAGLHGGPAGSYLLTDGHRLLQLTDPSPEVRATVPAEAPDAWRRLDVVLATTGLVGALWGRPDDPSSLLVAHDVPEALRLAGERAGVALLLRPPSPADVAAVARAGARMPRKSTLFVPKPRTGLVLRPHRD